MMVALLTSCGDFDPKGAPEVPDLALASNVTATVKGRSVTLNWQLPSQAGITGVLVSRNAGTPTTYPAGTTTCTLKGQPTDEPLVFTVKVAYEGGYVSEGTSVQVTVPYVETKMAYLLLADAPANLPDDDEVAAAQWFAKQQRERFR